MNNKLQGKDLINIGIFTAIYFIVIFAAASIGFIPIFIPLISVIVPLVGGIPMMLFFSKIKKFGMLTICGVLLGIIMLLTGMGWWCIPMTVDLSAEPSFNVHVKLDRYIAKLNEYGKQGWRLISGTDDWKYSIFEREIEDKED